MSNNDFTKCAATSSPVPHPGGTAAAPKLTEENGNEGRANGFPHEKLDAYWIALDMVNASREVANAIPRGHRSVADHLLRAAANAVLLLAEGADRRTPGEKRQRFAESRAECGEVASAADLVLVLKLGPGAPVEELKRLAGRVSAMLTGLIGRLKV